jgi:hypothetical protein
LPPTLPDLGISKDRSSKWQKLADIPEEEFNEAVTDPHVIPSTEGILAAVAPPVELLDLYPHKYDKDALLAHGRILGLAELVAKRPGKELFDLMLDFERDEVAALIPAVIAWLQEMK